ncbi:MAG: phosphomannomutase/phosphoglucomutase [Burkholderiaceae bacterium]|nr:phosphomannomutase/phosphoglucomutase [Burkholderiaceae bacterium]
MSLPSAPAASKPLAAGARPPEVPAGIFKAYDIRGIVDETLTEGGVAAIGLVLGARAREEGVTSIVVGRDGRLSGPRLAAALASGIVAAGVDVVDIGMVPTPLVYFATVLTGSGTGVAVTGSHNPPEYNGLKMMIAGRTLYGEEITAIGATIRDAGAWQALFADKPGQVGTRDVVADYVARITGDVKLARPMKVVVDAGNGVAGAVAPGLLRAIGAEVTELYCEVDGNFPNHHPDPAHPENLQDLIATVAAVDAEVGLAFDGDGDRLGVVTRSGRIVFPDRQLMLYAADVLSANPGAQIIYDVKCTRNLAPWIREHGGEPLMWRTGHSLIKAKLKETGAKLAGEMSGHVFFNDRWYGFDDGIYTAARLLEILSRHADPSAVLEALPDSPTTPELHLKLAEGENFRLIEALQKNAKFDGATEVITIDGVRVEYPDGFGLARASNTTPVVVLRFEADSPEALARIQGSLKQAIQAAMPGVTLPY